MLIITLLKVKYGCKSVLSCMLDVSHLVCLLFFTNATYVLFTLNILSLSFIFYLYVMKLCVS